MKNWKNAAGALWNIRNVLKSRGKTAVENYFLVHSYVSNDQMDYNTLLPILEKDLRTFGDILETITADSGYRSEKTDASLEERNTETKS